MKPPEKHGRQPNEASDDESIHRDFTFHGEADNSILTNSSSGGGNVVISGETDDDLQDAESENSAGHKVNRQKKHGRQTHEVLNDKSVHKDWKLYA